MGVTVRSRSAGVTGVGSVRLTLGSPAVSLWYVHIAGSVKNRAFGYGNSFAMDDVLEKRAGLSGPAPLSVESLRDHDVRTGGIRCVRHLHRIDRIADGQDDVVRSNAHW